MGRAVGVRVFDSLLVFVLAARDTMPGVVEETIVIDLL